MATMKIGTGIPYRLYQDNRSNSTHPGEWYAKAKAFGTVDLDGLAEHVAAHGSTFTKADIAGVLYKMQDCLLELLLQGYKVTIGDLGTFYLTISTKPAATIDDFSVSSNIAGVNLRFLPSGKDINNLTSKELRKGTRFINVADLVAPSEKAAVDAKHEEDAEEPGGGV